jgi:GTP-binding protein YchF
LPVLPSSCSIPFGPLVAVHRDETVFDARDERRTGVLAARTVAAVQGFAGWYALTRDDSKETMKLGIIGLPQSGKTTLFNALTRGDTPTTASAGRIEVHTAVVNVPDERLDALSAMFKPKKTTYAKVTYADIAGLESGAAKTGLSGELLNRLAQMDGFIHVTRCFESDRVPHPAGTVDPVRDMENMLAELLLNDLIAVERKLERLTDERRKGGSDKSVVDKQIAFFERLQAVLSEERPLRDESFTAEELKELSSYGLLTLKPILTVFNLGEGQAAPDIELDHPSVALQGKLEMEIAQLPAEDAAMFMEEYGIQELSLSRMIRLSYDLLKLQSFFTVGDDEVRAWTTRRGAPALDAAGEVHTDLQKGFIRAEVVTYDDLIALGSMAEAKAKGKLRLEGKEYPVQDGDIIQVRFNL